MRSWFPRVLATTLFAGMMASGAAFLAPRSADAEGVGKNLKVLPSTLSKADLKALMKKQANALGVQCDFCHDEDDYAKDTEKKEIARGMLKMTAEINKSFFKGKDRVGCITCHNGSKEPKKPG